MSTTLLELPRPTAPPPRIERARGTMLDQAMPSWDATRVERRLIDASTEVIYDVAIRTDFLDAVKQHPAVRVLLALRSGTERIVSAVRLRRHVSPPPPPSLRLIDLPRHGDWVLLWENPPNEICFGVIGRFWSGETQWMELDARDFSTFREPGFARIGCHLLVETRNDGTNVLKYEARTQATDPASRRAFLRYWRIVSPFVGVVMRSTLRVIERNVKRRLNRA
jgi:hypothetical protein